MPVKEKAPTPDAHDLPDDPVMVEEETALPAPIPQPAKRSKTYIFPDIDGGGPSVKIDATSIDEAQALYRTQKGDA